MQGAKQGYGVAAYFFRDRAWAKSIHDRLGKTLKTHKKRFRLCDAPNFWNTLHALQKLNMRSLMWPHIVLLASLNGSQGLFCLIICRSADELGL
jgi:hypothetical protein